MIKAKITSKNEAVLKRELPMEIHQLYHNMCEAGIMKSPRSILLNRSR